MKEDLRSDSGISSHNSILKTKIAVLLLAVFLVLSMTSCTNIGSMDKERAKAVAEAAGQTRTDLEEAFSAATAPEEMLDAVVAFADENEIYYKVVNNNSIILIKQAGDQNKAASDLTMHCSISSADPAGSAAQTAALLTALKEASNSGKTTVVVTIRDGLFYTGAMALPADYLDTHYLINVSDAEEAVLFKNSASLDTHRFNHEPAAQAIEGYKSYEITIDGLPRSTPEQIDEEQTDPVLIMYDLLSWCEQSHIDYYLSSLKAGDSVETLPQGAVMTISIDPSDITKFQNKVYGMIEEFNEEHKDLEAVPSFTLRHIDPLTSAVAPADTTDLLGLIYTLLSNSDYLSKNEADTTVGRQDISLIDISTNSMNFTISCRFMDASKEHDDSSAFKELARLNNFTVLDREIYPRWTPDAESLEQKTFEYCAEEAKLTPHSESTVDILETGVFAMKNPDLAQLAVGISPDDCADLTKALIIFIEAGGQQSL